MRLNIAAHDSVVVSIHGVDTGLSLEIIQLPALVLGELLQLFAGLFDVELEE